jgi:peptidoglycan hydrolase-like protein with peptidoglycan-binding domain
LKIDGIFGEKTEKCVIKFQKYKVMSQNGVVTDHIWSLMLEHADNIIHDAKI